MTRATKWSIPVGGAVVAPCIKVNMDASCNINSLYANPIPKQKLLSINLKLLICKETSLYTLILLMTTEEL